jgi:mono/diheme cytochrome c family protein
MKSLVFVGGLLLTLICSSLATAGEQDDAVAVAAHAVFKAKCASCHGPGVAKPKGNFGYVLNLRKLAANPELVIPGKVEESELWAIIERDEMPPGRPLPDKDKDAIRSWIAAGAPAGPAFADDAPVDSGLSKEVRRMLGLVGKFHLLLLHFPIALLIAGAGAEVWTTARARAVPSPVVRFCVLTGAIAAVPTALLGWAYAAAGHGGTEPVTLDLHRWIGTATAGWSVVTAIAVERDFRRGKRGSMGQVLVLIGAVLVGTAAHFGGALVHGDDFLSW